MRFRKLRETSTKTHQNDTCVYVWLRKQGADGTVHDRVVGGRFHRDPGDERTVRDGANERQSVRRERVARRPRALRHDHHQPTAARPPLRLRLRRVPHAQQSALRVQQGLLRRHLRRTEQHCRVLPQRFVNGHLRCTVYN